MLAWRNEDFCNVGKYIAKSTNIKQEVQNLCRGLSKENQIWLLRQIHRARYAYQSGKDITNLTEQESNERRKIYNEFYPNIFKIDEDLYAYDGFLVPQKIYGLEVFYHKHNLHILEPQTLAKMRGKDFIDVGASIGDSAIVFERDFSDKNIYSFEPTKQRYELMLHTLKLNNSSRVIPINKGLGAQNSTIKIDANIASSILIRDDDKIENIEIITLDNFVQEHKIEVGFIKVDTEGFEMEFLKGAKETICTQKPAMLISIYHSGEDYFHIKPLIESWNLGYKFKIYKGIDGTITEETGLYCEIVE